MIRRLLKVIGVTVTLVFVPYLLGYFLGPKLLVETSGLIILDWVAGVVILVVLTFTIASITGVVSVLIDYLKKLKDYIKTGAY